MQLGGAAEPGATGEPERSDIGNNGRPNANGESCHADAVEQPKPGGDADPRPTPGRPTRVRYAEGFFSCEGVVLGPEDSCDEFPSGDSKVTWKKPRTKGLEVRVYGVTDCLASDLSGAMIDGGWCLRQQRANDTSGTQRINGVPYLEHTALPPSLLVLLAKAPAARGKVTFRMDDYGLGYLPDPEYTYPEGLPLFAIAAAVYDSDGQRSPFTVVFSSHWCEEVEDLACPDGYYAQWHSYFPGW